MATRIHRFDDIRWPGPQGWQQRLPYAISKALGGLLALVLPKANPDLEAIYDHVAYWWLEIDGRGLVTREIGFTRDGRPIAAAPLGDNWGIFTDLDGAPRGLGAEIDAAAFEAAWRDVTDRFRPGIAGAGLL